MARPSRPSRSSGTSRASRSAGSPGRARSSGARRSRSSLVLRWIAAAVLGAIVLSYVPPLRAYAQARGEVAERKEEVVALEERNRDLERRVAYARTAAFVEREARKLGLVRPGERLFIVKRAGG